MQVEILNAEVDQVQGPIKEVRCTYCQNMVPVVDNEDTFDIRCPECWEEHWNMYGGRNSEMVESLFFPWETNYVKVGEDRKQEFWRVNWRTSEAKGSVTAEIWK